MHLDPTYAVIITTVACVVALLVSLLINIFKACALFYSFWINHVSCFFLRRLFVCRFRRVRVTLTKTGVFVENGLEYFRETPESPLMVLESVDIVGKVPHKHYGMIPQVPQSESAINSTVGNVAPCAYPKCMVHVGLQSPKADTVDRIGAGWRLDEVLTMPRHLLVAETITVWTDRGSIELKSKDALFEDSSVYKNSAFDLCFFKLDLRSWAILSATKIALKNLSFPAFSNVTIHSNTHHPIVAWGTTTDHSAIMAPLGTNFHNVGTAPGFSGSPLMAEKTKVVGMHIAGKATDAPGNVFITARAILQSYQKVFNLVEKNRDAYFDTYLSESKDKRGKQYEWTRHRLDDDEQTYFKIQSELLNDTVQSTLFGQEGQLGDDLENDNARFRSRLKKAGFSERPDLSQMKQSVYYDVLAEPLCGERYWKRRTDEELLGAESPFSIPATEADDHDVKDLFKRLAEGDFSALSDASGITFQSLYESPLLASFRHMLDSSGVEDLSEEVVTALDKLGRPATVEYASFRGSRGKEEGDVVADDDTVANVKALVGTDLEGFTIPGCRPQNVSESLRSQFSTLSAGCMERLTYTEAASLEELWESYPTAHPDTSYEALASFISGFDDKSAGWTATYQSGSKKNWATTEKTNLLIHLAYCRMLLRASALHKLPTMSPRVMVSLGLKDPEVGVVKGEPHNKTKSAAKKWRVIWIQSALDSVCTAAFHVKQNKADIRAYQQGRLTVQAAGMGFHDEGIKHFVKVVTARFGEQAVIMSDDASGWDLSVTREDILLDCQRRASCAVASEGWSTGASGDVESIGYLVGLLGEAFCLSSHVLAVGRKLVEVQMFGITGSGILSTTSQNCAIRGAKLRLCGAKNTFVNGDDALYDGDVDLDKATRLGVTTKPGSHVVGKLEDGDVSFCSHMWNRLGASFQNFDKMVARAVLKGLTEEGFYGCMFPLRHSPDLLMKWVNIGLYLGVEAADHYRALPAELLCEIAANAFSDEASSEFY